MTNVGVVARGYLLTEVMPFLKESQNFNIFCICFETDDYEYALKYIPQTRILFVKFDNNPSHKINIAPEEYRLLNCCRILSNGYSGKENIYSNIVLSLKDFFINNDIKIIFDEEIATSINLAVQRAVNDISIKVLRIQSCWVPDSCFFSSSFAQKDVYQFKDSRDSFDLTSFYSLRLKGLKAPSYVPIKYNALKKITEIFYLTISIFRNNIFPRHKQISYDSANVTHRNAIFLSLFSMLSMFKYRLPSVGGGKNLLLPLHFEPEAVLYSWSKYNDQLDLCMQIADNLPDGWVFYIKEHPQQPGMLSTKRYRSIFRKFNNVFPIKGSINSMTLSNVDAVITYGSNLSLDMALKGIPSICFGGSHFSKAPWVTVITSINSDFGAAMSGIANKSIDSNVVLDWYTDFMNKHCLSGNILPGNITVSLDDIEALIKGIILDT